MNICIKLREQIKQAADAFQSIEIQDEKRESFGGENHADVVVKISVSQEIIDELKKQDEDNLYSNIKIALVAQRIFLKLEGFQERDVVCYLEKWSKGWKITDCKFL